MTTYFHGGVPGLQVGDTLLPPDQSGATHTLSAHAKPGTIRTDRVYVTPAQDAARVYAALYPNGAIYRVVPNGGVEPDPDAPDVAFMCVSALIVEVVRPRIVMAHRRVDSWLRLLRNATTGSSR